MASMAETCSIDSQQRSLFDDKAHEIDAAGSLLSLLEVTLSAICSLLKRKDDAEHLKKTLTATSKYFMATINSRTTPPGEKLANLKQFAKEIVRIVIVERGLIAKGSDATAASEAPCRRVVDLRPDALADLQPIRLVALQGLAEVDRQSGRSVPDGSRGNGSSGDGVGPDGLGTDISGPDRPDSVGAGFGASDGGGLSSAVDPTAIVAAAPPPPQSFDGFTALFPAAIRFRIERVTSFFQRYNPSLARDLARPFLLSRQFSDRLGAVVTGIIVPRMVASRSISVLETSRKWAGVDVARFWEIIDGNDRLKRGIVASWAAAWDDCRQRKVVREEGGVRKTVLVASPLLQQVRDGVAPEDGEYLVPVIRNGEIDLFASMLYDFDLDRLEYTWTRLRQLYEQELDRRAYQDKARTGAFRDSILNAFEMVPDRSGDFLALLCYFCFPNIDLAFLDRFTHNKGSTVDERRQRIPYLMQFLAGPGVEGARRLEELRRREREQAQAEPQAQARAREA